MKRAFVILFVLFALVATVGSGFAAQSDLSPFHGLTFDEPISTFANLDVRQTGNIDVGTGHEIAWGCYTLTPFDLVGTFDVAYFGIPFLQNNYDTIKVGEMGVVEKGSIESLAGLPTFYVITEWSINGTVDRLITWYIICEDRHFLVQSGMLDYNVPSMQLYHEQQNKIFDDFLKSLGATSELKPGVIDDGDDGSGEGNNNGGENDSGDTGGGGGCNAGGLFSLAVLVGACALQKGKKA